MVKAMTEAASQRQHCPGLGVQRKELTPSKSLEHQRGLRDSQRELPERSDQSRQKYDVTQSTNLTSFSLVEPGHRMCLLLWFLLFFLPQAVQNAPTPNTTHSEKHLNQLEQQHASSFPVPLPMGSRGAFRSQQPGLPRGSPGNQKMGS